MQPHPAMLQFSTQGHNTWLPAQFLNLDDPERLFHDRQRGVEVSKSVLIVLRQLDVRLAAGQPEACQPPP